MLRLPACVSLVLLAHVVVASPPPCDSEIYCFGPILHEVQKAKLFDDDKYFVDMSLRETPNVVLTAFRNLSTTFANTTIPSDKLHDFVNMYFEAPKTESCNPPDWHSSPKFLERIQDEALREWAKEIHSVWKSLCWKASADVKDHPERYSQIYSPYPVIIAGQRFREFYYWDSYWAIGGLLLSEMTDTVNGMIRNLIYYVNRYGFVPNGGRIYYERRSQPPFLTPMVESFYQATKDKEFLRAALPALQAEYQFWMRDRSVVLEVDGTQHVLNRYFVQVGLPRPESYTDDLELAEGLSDEAKEELWFDLKSAAESGWDFSTRWYTQGPKQKNSTLRDTRTSRILPADLNALLCRTERTLAAFHRALGEGESAAQYEAAAAARLRAVEAVLWDAERGAWFDYNLATRSRHTEFYPSNLAPLWAQCYSQPEMAERAVQYLKGSGALQFPGGVPTSLRNSGQQWDYPNAWAPLQHMLIEGLSKLPSAEAQKLAFDLAQRWIKTMWLAYKKYGAMFEKYDVSREGEPGGGGEYVVQVGFGWTNGVALQLLNQYGGTLTSGNIRQKL